MKMILYVDDQAFLSKILRHFLEEIGGFELVYARSVKEAREVIRENGNKIQLCLIDIMMPLERDFEDPHDKVGHSTGLRLSQWIKSELPDVRIWAITVRYNLTENELRNSGISKLITIPFDPNELLQSINHNLS